MGIIAKPRLLGNCAICGIEFEQHRRESSVHFKTRRFCSHKCRSLHLTKISVVSCPVCGKDFRPERVAGKFCSIQCSNKSRMRIGPKPKTHKTYVFAKHHNGPRILEHRRVMEEKLGRSLLPGEQVHHLNGDKKDNKPENLELWFVSQPSGQRPEDLADYLIDNHREMLMKKLSSRERLLYLRSLSGVSK